MQQGEPSRNQKDICTPIDSLEAINCTPNLEPMDNFDGPEVPRFDSWIDSKLKLDALFEINKSSDLTDDWQWLQDNVFELQPFYKE